jgi:hypothetical protein
LRWRSGPRGSDADGGAEISAGDGGERSVVEAPLVDTLPPSTVGSVPDYQGVSLVQRLRARAAAIATLIDS